jgi:hypothetical protein
MISIVLHNQINLQKMETKISRDLQKFMDIYEPSKFKLLTKGVEIRGVRDIHQNINQAKELIDRLKLNLIISHNAEMLSYGGFEVHNS